MTTIYPDVSEHQDVVNDSFNREFLMCRVSNENGRIDYKIGTNLAWAKRNRGSKLKNFGGYVIPCNIPNSVNLNNLDSVGFPKDAVVMIDLESWNGLVRGNHTADINDLATRLRARQNGRADLVWLYANGGDYQSLYPGPRLPWLDVIAAGYQRSVPTFAPNMIGWQYTNGTENYQPLPSATPPFGNCDHNILYVPIPLPTPIVEDDMFEALDRSMVKQIFNQLQLLVDGANSAKDAEAVARQVQQTVATLPKLATTLEGLPAAVVAKLPPANTGGITADDVKAAVKAALAEGVAPV